MKKHKVRVGDYVKALVTPYRRDSEWGRIIRKTDGFYKVENRKQTWLIYSFEILRVDKRRFRRPR